MTNMTFTVGQVFFMCGLAYTVGAALGAIATEDVPGPLIFGFVVLGVIVLLFALKGAGL